ncbi:MAG: hypothetical protein MJ106_01710 [Lentisphaeria bacterium]|nr:hypothetical protein [Lentisphaeria bacterium]
MGIQPYVGYVDATTDWNALCLYGELSPSHHANTPFGIDFELNADEKYYKRSYQSLYYTHGEDTTYDEVGSEGDSSLYEIIANTRLGAAYRHATDDGTTNHFEALLKDDTAHQLQFRNTKDNDGHIVSRYGYLAFAEGSKFDINQIVMPDFEGDAADIPYVTDGNLTIGEAGSEPEIAKDGKNVDVGTSTYAIMGYDYDSENVVDNLYDNGKITETETVQYGVHPQELQTRIVSNKAIYKENLERGVADKPSRWFNYDMLTENETIGDEFKEKDLFVYSVASGTEDKELRFNGMYASEDDLQDELLDTADSSMDSITSSDSNFLKKANIAYPWGLYCDQGTCDFSTSDDITWDKISEKMRAANDLTSVKNLTQHFFQKHLGLNYDKDNADHYLFKNSSVDKTPNVFANMVDFCDADFTVTALDADGNRIKFSEGDYNVQPNIMDLAADKIINEPTFCSNERVPSIVGVNVAMGLNNNGGNWLVTRRGQAKDSNNVNRYVYRIEVGPGSINFTPKVTLSMQNFFNEELSKTKQKYRVIVQGKITPFLLAKRKLFNGQEQYTNVLVFLKGNSMTSSSPASPWQNNADSNDYGLFEGSANRLMISNEIKSNGLHFSIDKTTDLLDRQFDALENQSVEIDCDTLTVNIPNTFYTNDEFGLPTRLLTGHNSHYLTGTGYALTIEKVMVMVQNDENDGDEICELMYAEAGVPEISYNYVDFKETAPTTLTDQRSFWNPAKTTNTAAYHLVNYSPVNGVTCKDPRLNHLSSQWTWYENHAEKLNANYFGENFVSMLDNTADGQGYNRCLIKNCVNNNVMVGSLPWAHGKLAKVALANVKNAMRNETHANAQKDWEPEFDPGDMDMTAAASDYCKGTMDNTLSTYFIPNYPFTSLWQLGAIHRGGEGQTLNLKKFGTDEPASVEDSKITHTYVDGDAWLLDYICLNELSNDGGVRGKFNPNCFNAPAYRFLFANIPANPDAEDTSVYANGMLDPDESADEIVRNDYFKDYVDENWSKATEELEETTFRFRVNGNDDFGDYADASEVMAAQSWSPVQAFFNFVEIDGGAENTTDTLQCNDRQAESLIGCTAGIMSTRYETYTVISVGQNLKWIMANDDMPSGDDGINFRKQLANPIQIGGGSGDWYSILSTEVRLVTLVRDCWFGKIKVLKSQIL